MRLYNRYFQSNYDELITYYPRYYRDVYEMREILKAFGRLADNAENSIERAYLNCFIDEADEATLNKLMEFLHIDVTRSQTLTEKRGLIKMCIIGHGKLSGTLLKEMLAAYTNAPIEITFEPFDDAGNNRLIINCIIPEGDKFVLSDVKPILMQKIPAHIEFLLMETIDTDNEIYTEQNILLIRIDYHWRIYFWGLRVFDGTWLLDGDTRLNAKLGYKVPVGLLFHFGPLVNCRKHNGEWVFDGSRLLDAISLGRPEMRTMKLGTHIHLKENIKTGIKSAGYAVDNWKQIYFNGEKEFNGFWAFPDSKRQQCSHGRIKIGEIISAQSEEFLADKMIIKCNLWYLDGGITFGESTKLNAFIKKEAI